MKTRLNIFWLEIPQAGMFPSVDGNNDYAAGGMIQGVLNLEDDDG